VPGLIEWAAVITKPLKSKVPMVTTDLVIGKVSFATA